MTTAATTPSQKLLRANKEHRDLLSKIERTRSQLLQYLADLLHHEVTLTVKDPLGNYRVHLENRNVAHDENKGAWDTRNGPVLENGTSFNCIVKRVHISPDGRAYLVFFVLSTFNFDGNPMSRSYLLPKHEYRLCLDELVGVEEVSEA